MLVHHPSLVSCSNTNPAKHTHTATNTHTSPSHMDICSWIHNLPGPDSWPESDPQLLLELATSNSGATPKSILLKAERTSGSNTEALVTFSVCLRGFFQLSNPHKTLWVSNPCPLSTSKPFLPLLLQLLEDIITRAPTAHDNGTWTPPLKLDPAAISRVLGSFPPDQLSHFFNLVFLCRLFWLCVYDAPAEAGSLYFQTLVPCFNTFLVRDRVIAAFLTAIGADGELLFMRTVGYILVKWSILREVSGISHPSLPHTGFSYGRESQGFWVLRGYAPVSAMSRTVFNSQQDLFGLLEAKESVLRYTLAHQQLEAVVQLEYSVRFHGRFIQVGIRLDNLRIHVTRLGFVQREEAEEEPEEYAGERHFPSRVRVTIGPGTGSSCVAGLTLGRSTCNPEREVETQRVVKGSFGNSKFPKMKATAKTASTVRMRTWRWDQDAEGNTAVFEGVLCDNGSGVEVATWRPGSGGRVDPRVGFRKRYSGASRAFSKVGGLVFAGDAYGEEVSWRLGKDEVRMMMERDGGDLKWRLGGKVWVSYWPDEVKTNYYETRCVEWCEEVELPIELQELTRC